MWGRGDKTPARRIGIHVWRVSGALGLALTLAACGGPDAPQDVCRQDAPVRRDLAGFFNGQPEGVQSFVLLPVTGTATRK